MDFYVHFECLLIYLYLKYVLKSKLYDSNQERDIYFTRLSIQIKICIYHDAYLTWTWKIGHIPQQLLLFFEAAYFLKQNCLFLNLNKQRHIFKISRRFFQFSQQHPPFFFPPSVFSVVSLGFLSFISITRSKVVINNLLWLRNGLNI